MHIVSFQVENYKSFLSTQEIHLTPGFNIIVGENNAGKTALVEALNLKRFHDPHRSLETVPTRTSKYDATSKIIVSFELSRKELIALLSRFDKFYVRRLQPSTNASAHLERFTNALSERNIIKSVFHSGRSQLAYLLGYSDASYSGHVHQFRIDPSSEQPELVNTGHSSAKIHTTFANELVNILSEERIYMFTAERLNLGKTKISPALHLAPDASNLAAVLNLLQTSNVNRFQLFNELVSTVFPDIQQITVPPISQTETQILVWSIDPTTERDDLAMPLEQCGTGIGQVLAMLYVALTSKQPKTIIIDEPQSFLHPGAVRKLFDIFRFEQHAQHQYIITTHSPTVVASANPQTFFMVRKQGAESTVEEIDVEDTHKLRIFLSEIGARLSDVFGADNILWVEGRTEELCFPLILSKIVKKPLLGTEIIGVMQTGDFDRKHSRRTIFRIYRRLSEGRGLLPPAIGFIFDREGRSKQDRDDLIKESGGTVSFTPRRMYENYLLNPHAIAFVMSSIEDERQNPIEVQEIETWLQKDRWEDKRYFENVINEQERIDEVWITEVHGANILEDLFKEFFEHRFTFNKTEHGLALTEWIVENAPEDLEEVAELIQNFVGLYQ
jgi:predicted ATPase